MKQHSLELKNYPIFNIIALTKHKKLLWIGLVTIGCTCYIGLLLYLCKAKPMTNFFQDTAYIQAAVQNQTSDMNKTLVIMIFIQRNKNHKNSVFKIITHRLMNNGKISEQNSFSGDDSDRYLPLHSLYTCTHICMYFSSFMVCYMPCPSHPPWFDHRGLYKIYK
jgi:hypothetical protein